MVKDSDLDDLEKLSELKTKGFITQEEFDLQKQKILSKDKPKANIKNKPKKQSVDQSSVIEEKIKKILLSKYAGVFLIVLVLLIIIVNTSIGIYRHHKANSINTEYYTSGEIKSETPMVDGKIDGTKKEYYVTGQLKAEIPFVQGKKHGMVKEYGKDGSIKQEILWEHNKPTRIHTGIENTAFYTKGIPSEATVYRDGEMVKKIGYYYSGKVRSEVEYKDGKPYGIGKCFYESGKVNHEHPYKDGVYDGVEKQYYEDGTLSQEVIYKSGVKEGVGKTYYPGGSIKAEIPFENGLRNGVVKIYYPNKKLKEKSVYVNDHRQGEYKLYHENGVLYVDAVFADGIGRGVTYDEQGNEEGYAEITEN